MQEHWTLDDIFKADFLERRKMSKKYPSLVNGNGGF